MKIVARLSSNSAYSCGANDFNLCQCTRVSRWHDINLIIILQTYCIRRIWLPLSTLQPSPRFETLTSAEQICPHPRYDTMRYDALPCPARAATMFDSVLRTNRVRIASRSIDGGLGPINTWEYPEHLSMLARTPYALGACKHAKGYKHTPLPPISPSSSVRGTCTPRSPFLVTPRPPLLALPRWP